MQEKELDDKIKIKALLETYSVKDISNIFSNIDNKLMSLHECSSDDFLKLNGDFKHLFKQSKIISENVNSIFDLYNENENIDSYNEIHRFYNHLKNQIEIFDNKIVVTMKFIEELSNQLRFIFFPIKNYIQNLMSLKYLIANLNVTIPFTDQQNILVNRIKTIENIINEIKQLTERISKNLNHLRKVAKISISNFSQVKNQNEVNIEYLLNIVKSRISNVENKFLENKDCLPKIRKKTEKSAENISDIIKKLQYQDIIKQKMEHIQLTHKDLIKELEEFENFRNDEMHLNEKAKFFLRIRDIAGLQAAQLIQANKEYQSALEIIVNNFIQIGDNMNGISEMCGNINENESDSEVELFKEILEQITITEKDLLEKFDQNKKLYKDVLVIDHQLVHSETHVSLFEKLNKTLASEMQSYLKDIKEYSLLNSNIKNSTVQIQQLNNEIGENSAKIKDLANKLLPINTRIHSFINEHNNLTLSTDFEEIKKVSVKLNMFRENVNQVLNENRKISNKALDDIKRSISGIKYYDYFDNIIEEIIKELNTLNYNLKVGEEDNKSKDENLERLKEYYTMETEHVIHDSVTKGEEIDIDIDNDEDGEIEFF
jgi:hypothetical protein